MGSTRIHAVTTEATAAAVSERSSRTPVQGIATFRLRVSTDVFSRHRHKESSSRPVLVENSPSGVNTRSIVGKIALDAASSVRSLHGCHSEPHIERPSPALALTVQAYKLVPGSHINGYSSPDPYRTVGFPILGGRRLQCQFQLP